jgi:uncharacterized RDD family membrane protein YckC
MTVSSVTLDSKSTTQATSEEEVRPVGVVTRAVSWLVDWGIINLGAVLAGVGASLVLAIFPLSKNLKPAFQAIAGAAYILWAAAYFVVFWSMTGQTLGARFMQIRLVTAKRGRVKPARALVRWVGMNLGILFLGAGYIPILFGRRPLPDWLAKTLVLDAPQLSIAGARLASLRAAARNRAAPRPAGLSPESEPDSPRSGDGPREGPGLAEPARRDPS